MDIIEQGIQAQKANMKEHKPEFFEASLQEARVVRRRRGAAPVEPEPKAQEGLEGGHTEKWGSFKHPHFGLGYKCCYSFEKYTEGAPKCLGEVGKQA